MSEVIAVGLTDAPVADRALAWAATRARDRRQRLRLISILGGAVGVVGEDALVQGLLAAMRERAERAAAGLRAEGLEVEVIVERGNPTEKLIAAAEGAALLVIGSDHRGPEAGATRGPHGFRIVSTASCPVVVVPDVELGERRGVVVGVDGSETSEHAVAWAAAEADRLGEPLIAVGAWVPLPSRSHGHYPEQYLQNMQALTEENLSIALAGLRGRYPDLEIVARAERGHPAEMINRHAATARLVVVGTHGRGAFRRFVLGSVSYDVLADLAAVTAAVR
ncbi:universal stress protein [Microbacterium invictum]|uniref:Universal stress protein n=1 Tax=Microbacterium invictum TaxID=515415 RepID=A0ABZ0VCY6_9MICO|nr:universal stress protein [Microbacterium invictum]WQB70758.1 universal stress protein [Microbacterium invictum]